MGLYGIIWYIMTLIKSKKKNQTVCKPDSVPQFNFQRLWSLILDYCYQQSLASYHAWCKTTPVFIFRHKLFWTCSQRGLQSHLCYHKCGRLLPYHFTLTITRGGFFSVALSLGLPPPAINRLWCSGESGLSSFKRRPYNRLVIL